MKKIITALLISVMASGAMAGTSQYPDDDLIKEVIDNVCDDMRDDILAHDPLGIIGDITAPFIGSVAHLVTPDRAWNRCKSELTKHIDDIESNRYWHVTLPKEYGLTKRTYKVGWDKVRKEYNKIVKEAS